MPGKRQSRRVIAERRRGIYLGVLRGLSIAQLSSKHRVSEKTVDRDLAALRKGLGSEAAKRLRLMLIANANKVFTREKSAEFISLCQKIIRGEASLRPKPVLHRFSKTNAEGARKIVSLLRTTDRSFRQIAKEASANRRTVNLAYQDLVARGENIPPRGRAPQISKRTVAKKNFPDPEGQINTLERMAQKAGLTLQEKAGVYCKLVGMEQQEMARIVGVSKLTIIRLLKSVRKEIGKVPSPKP
jgi:transposase